MTAAKTPRPAALPALARGLQAAARLVGARVLGLLHYLGELMMLASHIVTHILRGEVTRRESFDQMSAVGVGGIPLVSVTVAFSGAVFGVYSVLQFKQFGASNMIGLVVAMTMTRELAPVLAATVIAARTGSAIAAEIATMKITEQLDALRALATDPVEYLAVPRYIALVLTLPGLALIGMVCGTYGAGVVAWLNGITWREYFSMVPDRLPIDFVINGCIKAMIFGALIAISSLRQGFVCGYGSESVGKTTTQAVVYNIIWIHLANLLIALLTE